MSAVPSPPISPAADGQEPGDAGGAAVTAAPPVAGAAATRFASPTALLEAFGRRRAAGDDAALGDASVAVGYEEACAAMESVPLEERPSVRGALLQSFDAMESSLASTPRSQASSSSRPKRRRISFKRQPSQLDDVPPALTDDAVWAGLVLAAALPLLGAALPRDQHGCCVMPHPHPLVRRTARAVRYINVLGRPSYHTNRTCDNCDEEICDRVYYACSEGCDIDFCKRCHARLETLFSGLDQGLATWAARFVGRAASFALSRLGVAERRALVSELAFSWPAPMFERLVRAVADVADAKVVHLQDNTDRISADTEFWSTVGLLQLLYAANQLPANECRFGELVPRGPRVPRGSFVLAGIDKCDAYGEWQRWAANAASRGAAALGEGADLREATRALRRSAWQEVLNVKSLAITDDFASFLTHSNLLPTSFWQRCLQEDIHQVLAASERPRGRIRKLHVEVSRDPAALVMGVIHTIGGLDLQRMLARPIAVKFHGEPASGPGVTREFLRLATQGVVEARFPPGGCPHHGGSASCDASEAEQAQAPSASSSSTAPAPHGGAAERCDEEPIWECDPELRTYWFRAAGPPREAMALRALGALIGFTALSRSLLPVAFPPVFFELLLSGLGSRCTSSAGPTMRPRVFGLPDMAAVCPAMARSLERLVEYEGADVAELFVLDWPCADELRTDNRAEYVHKYLQWYFKERYADQMGPLVDGFRAVVGASVFLRIMVEPAQLESILCGAELPVDVAAIRSGATAEDWRAGDQEYLDSFWEVLQGLTDSEKRSFVMFVSACSRTPPRGWTDLGLRIQRSGSGDERLPTAFTCFNLLMLPRYSSAEVLGARLRRAIADTEGFGLS